MANTFNPSPLKADLSRGQPGLQSSRAARAMQRNSVSKNWGEKIFLSDFYQTGDAFGSKATSVDLVLAGL